MKHIIGIGVLLLMAFIGAIMGIYEAGRNMVDE